MNAAIAEAVELGETIGLTHPRHVTCCCGEVSVAAYRTIIREMRDELGSVAECTDLATFGPAWYIDQVAGERLGRLVECELPWPDTMIIVAKGQDHVLASRFWMYPPR